MLTYSSSLKKAIIAPLCGKIFAPKILYFSKELCIGKRISLEEANSLNN